MESTVEQHKDSEVREQKLNDALLAAKNEARMAAVAAQTQQQQASLDLTQMQKERDDALLQLAIANKDRSELYTSFEKFRETAANDWAAFQKQIGDLKAERERLTKERDGLTRERDALKEASTAPVPLSSPAQPDRTVTYYGITVREQTPQEREKAESEGVLVAGIAPGSPASESKLKVGDLIRKINDRRIWSLDGFTTIMKAVKPNSTVKLETTNTGTSVRYRFLKTPKG